MTTRKYLIATFCVLLFQVSRAQYIGATAGFGLPVGDFGNQNLNDPENGFANKGASFGLNLNYLIKNQIGFYAAYQYNTYSLNTAELSKQTNLTATPQTTVTIQSTSKYRANTLLIGPSIQIGKQNLTLQLRLVAGILSLSTPGYTTTTLFNNTLNSTSTASQESLSIAVGYGFGILYALPKDIYLMLNLDNVSGASTFVKGYQSSAKNTLQIPYQAYSLSVGLGYAIQ